jgi:hypothetical protein
VALSLPWGTQFTPMASCPFSLASPPTRQRAVRVHLQAIRPYGALCFASVIVNIVAAPCSSILTSLVIAVSFSKPFPVARRWLDVVPGLGIRSRLFRGGNWVRPTYIFRRHVGRDELPGLMKYWRSPRHRDLRPRQHP